LRRAIAGPLQERSAAKGVWAMALAVALLGTTAVLATGLVDLSGHRLMVERLPIAAIALGGLLFGVGMVLARGCASRLTVLAGTGNLRAVVVMVVFAVVAHATLKGVLAPIRTSVGSVGIDLGSYNSLAALPGGAILWAGLAALVLMVVALRSDAKRLEMAGGALIGALAPLGWLATGWLLKDDFDPVPVESLALTSAGAETLFWWIASSAIGPTFGVGFLAGIIAGSGLSSALSGDWKAVGFTEEVSTARYLAGGALMGFGGVLAGGCTVGAGLSGVPTLSVAAIVAFLSIIAGGLLAREILAVKRAGGISLIDAASAGAVFIP
jgi:uncharacterized membrane protein YedE/YeeE